MFVKIHNFFLWSFVEICDFFRDNLPKFTIFSRCCFKKFANFSQYYFKEFAIFKGISGFFQACLPKFRIFLRSFEEICDFILQHFTINFCPCSTKLATFSTAGYENWKLFPITYWNIWFFFHDHLPKFAIFFLIACRNSRFFSEIVSRGPRFFLRSFGLDS